jgi:hypothetical protein
MATFLNTKLPSRVTCYRKFLSSMVRRNVCAVSLIFKLPDQGIPPMVSRLIWVEQTTAERSLLQGLRDLTPVQTLMGCNHFHLAGVIRKYAGNDQNLSIAEVSKSKSRSAYVLDLQSGRLDKIKDNEKYIKDKTHDIKGYERDLAEIKRDESLPMGRRRDRKRNPDTGAMERPWPREYENETRVSNNKIKTGQDMIKKRTAEIRTIQSQFDFFDSLIRNLEDPKSKECPVCLNSKGEGELVSVLPCGHFTCSECCKGVIEVATPRNPATCPECRELIDTEPGKVMTVTIRQL